MPAVRHRWHRALARAARRAWFRFRARGIPLVYDPRYEQGVFGVPIDPLRGEKILAALDEAGLLAREALWTPRPASLQNLLRVHTAEYLHDVQEPETLTRICGVAMTAAEADAGLDLQRLMVGGTIQATRLALITGAVTAHLGGGFHHASADRGMAFCVFNDVAVAIRRLRARGLEEPVLVVDLDVHDGNGTRAIFADDPTVHTYSVHNEHWGPTEAVASTSIALGADVDDDTYLGVLRETLPPSSRRSVRASSSTSPAPTGPRTTASATGASPGRGSSSATASSRGSCAATTTRARWPWCSPGATDATPGATPPATFSGWPRAARSSPPRRRRSPSGASVAWARPARREGPDDDLPFTLTEEDLVGLVPGAAPAPRFLGYFSRHAVELLLERSGILAQLRAKGFRNLRVELDTRHGAGPHDPGRQQGDAAELLVEARAERSRRLVPDMEVIALEWLLLQNPRAEFSSRRPRAARPAAPGPGAAARLHGLAGRGLREPRARRGLLRDRALPHRRAEPTARPAPAAGGRGAPRRHGGGSRRASLAEATRPRWRAAWSTPPPAGRRSGGPLPAVLPVSERLRALVTGPEYDEAVAEAARRFSYRVAPRPPLMPRSGRLMTDRG